MDEMRHPIEHYVDTEPPNAGTQVPFSIVVKGPAPPGKGFLYAIQNSSDRAATAIVQKTDVIHNTRSWQLVNLSPGEELELGYDRPDGPVYRQWYFWTTSTGRQGSQPWYPLPKSDSPYGSLAVLEMQKTWFLVNRDTFNRCHVSWESSLYTSPHEETIDPGSLTLGDASVGSGHRLDIISASLLPPAGITTATKSA